MTLRVLSRKLCKPPPACSPEPNAVCGFLQGVLRLGVSSRNTVSGYLQRGR